MAFDATTQGLGVALESTTIAGRHIAERKLKPIFGFERAIKIKAHFAVYPARHAKRPPVEAFLAWLHREASKRSGLCSRVDLLRFDDEVARLASEVIRVRLGVHESRHCPEEAQIHWPIGRIDGFGEPPAIAFFGERVSHRSCSEDAPRADRCHDLGPERQQRIYQVVA